MARKKVPQTHDYDGELAETLDYVLALKETHGPEKAAQILQEQGFATTMSADRLVEGHACQAFRDPALRQKYKGLFGIVDRDIISINGAVGLTAQEIKERLADAKTFKKRLAELSALPAKQPKRDWMILKPSLISGWPPRP